MKKLVLLALAAATVVAAALAPVAGAAADAKGPPCANIINGDGSYTLTYVLHFEYAVKAPACADATYSLLVYDTSGTLITTLSPSTSGCTTLDPTIYPNCFAFDESLTSFGSPETICVVGQTTIRGRTVDTAPDQPSAGCAKGFALTAGGSGGTSGFG